MATSKPRVHALEGNETKPKLTTIDLVGGIYCHICYVIYATKKEYDKHYLEHNTGTKNITYTCVACHKEIVNYPNFRGHCYNLHVAKRFKCQYCPKVLSKKTAYDIHIKAMHNFKCTKKGCNTEFPTKKELLIHKIFHENEANKPPYQCQMCNSLITSIDACEEHIDTHCTFTYSCPICREVLSKESTANHLITHFDDEVKVEPEKSNTVSEISEDSSINVIGGILCSFCNKLYNNRQQFVTHFTEDHSEESIIYSCNVCKKHFETYAQFGNHCYDHYCKNKFGCDICEKSFNRLARLVVHMEMFHGGRGDAKPFKCPLCECRYSNEKAYKMHLRDVHDITQQSCTECGTKFDTLKDLLFHQKSHEASERSCKHCGLYFVNLAACKKHIDVHKKKLYSCPICKRQYGEKYLLMNHISQHFEAVFHMCKICGKIYTAKSRLAEHAKTHTTVRMYECKYCGKGFLKTNHLEQHVNMHTGAKPFKCTVCPKTFASQPNCAKHMRNIHNICGRVSKEKILVSVTSDVSQDKVDDKISEPDIKDDLMMDLKESLCDFVSDDSTMDSDGIVPTVTDSNILEVNLSDFNANNDDIIELSAVLHECRDTLMSLSPPHASEVSPPVPTEVIPREYGPDFVNTNDFIDCTGKYIDLDDHILPHIDPLLTINTEPLTYKFHNFGYDNYNHNIVDTIASVSKWEPPVLTKIYGNFYD